MPTGTHGFYCKGLMELVEEQAAGLVTSRSPLSPGDNWSRAKIDERMFWKSKKIGDEDSYEN